MCSSDLIMVCSRLAMLVLLLAASSPALAQDEVVAGGLGNIDFVAMIGGPLRAVVEAQRTSAQTTIDFINEVGFEKSTDAGAGPKDVQARTIKFEYQSTNGVTGLREAQVLEVPFLTIVPIPYLRIESCSVEFNAKINSVKAADSSTASSNTVSVAAVGVFGPAVVAVAASFSQQKSAKYSNYEEREYSMSVSVYAVQDDMPGGLRRMLDILEESIQVNPQTATATVTASFTRTATASSTPTASPTTSPTPTTTTSTTYTPTTTASASPP